MENHDTIQDFKEEIRKPERLIESLDKECGVGYEGIIPVIAIEIYKNI
jgi:hypothetical protein